MSNYEEEQALEIEALTSIFEEGKEFVKISDTEFKLKLLPHPQGEAENHVGFTLHVTYTAEYPETAPEWEVEDVKGLPDEKLKTLKGLVTENIESSLGMAMIYTVAEACQDFLKENNTKELSMHEEMLLRTTGDAGGKAEGDEDDDEEYDEDDDDYGANEPEEEWKGLAEKPMCAEADRVSPDTFAVWKAKFEEEMIAAGIFKKDEVKAKTGREIFLEMGPKDGADGKAAGGDEKKDGAMVYDAALFGEMEEDVDFDDLDDLDED